MVIGVNDVHSEGKVIIVLGCVVKGAVVGNSCVEVVVSINTV